MATTAGQFIAALASQQRVLIIGGLAVIAHGFNRPDHHQIEHGQGQGFG